MNKNDLINDEQDIELDLDELSGVSGGAGKTGGDNSKHYVNVVCKNCGKTYRMNRVFDPDHPPVCCYCGAKYFDTCWR